MHSQNLIPTRCQGLMTCWSRLDRPGTSKVLTCVRGTGRCPNSKPLTAFRTIPIYCSTLWSARGTCHLPATNGPSSPGLWWVGGSLFEGWGLVHQVKASVLLWCCELKNLFCIVWILLILGIYICAVIYLWFIFYFFWVALVLFFVCWDWSLVNDSSWMDYRCTCK